MALTVLVVSALIVVGVLAVVVARRPIKKPAAGPTVPSADQTTRMQPTGKVSIPRPPVPYVEEDKDVTELTLAVTSSRPFLRSLSGPAGSKTTFFLSPTGVTNVGRAPDNDIVLADAATSTRHCRIEQQGNSFTLVDLGSTNKTFLKGAAQDRALLRNGDQITIGDTTFIFVMFGDRT